LEGRVGAWTRYENHQATGWANLEQDAFFASHTGRVFSIRRVGDVTDYRDDSSAIEMEILLRALHFGSAGMRKVIDSIVAEYKVSVTSTGTVLATALDLNEIFTDTTAFRIIRSTDLSGIGDEGQKKLVTIRHSVGTRRGTYFQLQVKNTNIDEDLELVGINLRVAPLTERGLIDAADTAV
jgi:hypothetical protein